jgi:uncharacterized protein (TIGR02391 family)
VFVTPHGHRLKLALDSERRRMANEWFFKWHQIGRDGPVDIDSFDGRLIRYGGIQFGGTARDVYWDTLGRYVRKKVDEVFTQTEHDIEKYPLTQALSAVDETEAATNAFVAGIANDAVEKDRILRGNGTKFPARDDAAANRLRSANDASARAYALRKHVEATGGRGVQQMRTSATPPANPVSWPRGVHPKIEKDCDALLQEETLDEAVAKSFRIVRDRLRDISGYETASDAFGKGGLYIKGAAAKHVDEDFNAGVKFLMMAIDRFRNEKSHTSDGNIKTTDQAYRYLMMSSLAMDFLDRAEVRRGE